MKNFRWVCEFQVFASYTYSLIALLLLAKFLGLYSIIMVILIQQLHSPLGTLVSSRFFLVMLSANATSQSLSFKLVYLMLSISIFVYSICYSIFP